MKPGGRHGARRLLLQALYQRQVASDDATELRSQFTDREEFARIDRAFFLALLDEVLANTSMLDEQISSAADRPAVQLDPVERAVLWIGVAELEFHPDVPASVVINEAVELAKEFGAAGSHRYVNGVLDTLATRKRSAPSSP
jgi:N utilization substance protein B